MHRSNNAVIMQTEQLGRIEALEEELCVIVMTFWYVFWNGLTFFELFKCLFFTWD